MLNALAPGSTFVIDLDGFAEEIIPTVYGPEVLDLHSLDALVKLIRTEAVKFDTPLYITIPDHLTVRCFGQPDGSIQYHRQVYYEAKATDVPGWEEVANLVFEEAINETAENFV